MKLRAGALGQSKDGWVDGPRDFNSSGDIEILGKGNADVAFRYGICQFGKLSERGDVRHNMVNLATPVLTPISLPSWGHIAQLSTAVSPSNLAWSLLKTDHKDAYMTHLPIDPHVVSLTIVALRCSAAGRWRGFIP